MLRFRRSSVPAADGHDVLAVSGFQQRSVDKDLMELAFQGFWLARVRGTRRFAGRDPDPVPGRCERFARGGDHETGARTCLEVGGGLCSSSTGNGPY